MPELLPYRQWHSLEIMPIRRWPNVARDVIRKDERITTIVSDPDLTTKRFIGLVDGVEAASTKPNYTEHHEVKVRAAPQPEVDLESGAA